MSVKVISGVVSLVAVLFAGALIVEVGALASTVTMNVPLDTVPFTSVQSTFQLLAPSVSVVFAVIVVAVALLVVPLTPWPTLSTTTSQLNVVLILLSAEKTKSGVLSAVKVLFAGEVKVTVVIVALATPTRNSAIVRIIKIPLFMMKPTCFLIKKRERIFKVMGFQALSRSNPSLPSGTPLSASRSMSQSADNMI